MPSLVRRPAVAAALVYALLSLAFVGQGLLPGRTLSSSDFLWNSTPWTAFRPASVPLLGANFENADSVDVFEPFFQYEKDRFPDPPLWNPYVMGGRPFLADAQSAFFSPFTAPAYVMPLSKALGWMAVLKLWVAALGTFLLARALGMGFAGALASGIVYAFGTFFVVWIPWPLTSVFALFPWLLLATEHVVRRPGPLPVAGLAAAVAVQFAAGHPETSFHTIVAVLLFLLARLVGERRRGRPVVRPALAFGGGLVLGTAVVAAMLVPLFELLLRSADLAHRSHQAHSHMDPRFIGALLLHDYWGRPTQTTLVPFISNHGYYAGGITLMLGAAGLLLRPTATRIVTAGLGLAALLVALGTHPLFDLVVMLPGFKTAHNGRLVIFFLFALALLAGFGLDDLAGRAPRALPRRRVALAAAAVIFCIPVVWMVIAGTLEPGRLRAGLSRAWAFSEHVPAGGTQAASAAAAGAVRMSALLQWLPLAGAGLALMVLRLRPPGRRLALSAGAFAVLVCALLVTDLFRANMGFNPAIPEANARQPVTGAIRYLQRQRPNRFAGFDTNRPVDPIIPDVAMRYGLFDARGYDYPVEKRYDTWWRATSGPPEFFNIPTATAVKSESALRGMGLMSVADVIQDPADPPVRLRGAKLVYSGRDARIYRNAYALPRAFLVDRQRVVGGGGAALAATEDPSLDRRRVAVTERAIPGLARTQSGGGGAAGTARIVALGSEHVAVETGARRRSLLVLTDSFYPGWKATVDGHSATVEHADYLLRGVAVPPGRHRVEFTYAPASWRAGWIISLLALLALAALTGLGLRRRRAEGRPR